MSGELFDECRSQIRFDFTFEDNDFVLPGARSDRWLDIPGIDSEELGEGQRPDIRFGFEPSLPFLRFFLRFKSSFGGSFGCPVRIFDSTRRNPTAGRPVFVYAHIFLPS